MSAGEVLSLLGQPLSRDTSRRPEYWHYGEGPKISGLTISYGGGARFVCFGDEGTVIKVRGDLSRLIRVGMTHEEVLALAGRPRLVIPASREVWQYSAPSPEGKYRARAVAFGEHAKVVQVVAYETYD